MEREREFSVVGRCIMLITRWEIAGSREMIGDKIGKHTGRVVLWAQWMMTNFGLIAFVIGGLSSRAIRQCKIMYIYVLFAKSRGGSLCVRVGSVVCIFFLSHSPFVAKAASIVSRR